MSNAKYGFDEHNDLPVAPPLGWKLLIEGEKVTAPYREFVMNYDKKRPGVWSEVRTRVRISTPSYASSYGQMSAIAVLENS